MKLKNCLAGVIFGIISLCVPACSKGQTNSADVASNKIVWLVANADLLVREGKSDTNGLNCGLRITNERAGSGLATPICEVYAHSKTNLNDSFWKHYPTNYLEVELLDSSGNPVSRTAVGENYKYFPSEEQIEAAFMKAYNRSHRSTVQGFAGIGFFERVSLPELFNLKQSGEYTLKVRMRLLERNLNKPRESKFTITSLPEVAAKIKIQAQETIKVKLSTPNQTNSPSK